MSKRKRKIMFCLSLLIAAIGISIFIAVRFGGLPAIKAEKQSAGREKESGFSEETDSLLKALEGASVKQIEAADIKEPEETKEFTEEMKKDSLPDIPLTDAPVPLTDLYAQKGSTVEFKCFHKDAVSYEWEIYDMALKDWGSAEPESITNSRDELGRKISVLKVKSGEIQAEAVMVKCTLHFENKEDEIQTASLFSLEYPVKEIEIEDLSVDAGSYFSSCEVPVTVTYENGATDQIKGLYGLYFVRKDESEDISSTVSGNRVLTTTTVTTECHYMKADLKEEKILIRYYPNPEEETVMEKSVLITGVDEKAPEIKEVSISPFEISSVDQKMTLHIRITAEDNLTPYPYLEYAFVYGDQEPGEEDWMKNPDFDMDILQNGFYTAYVRDQAGNISKMEKEIITVDMKAPDIAEVSLSTEAGWCKSNTITVIAEDAGTIKYRFLLGTETDSGWITYHTYTVEENGRWIVQVKDEAGNITESEISVNNIDQAAPVIHEISIIE